MTLLRRRLILLPLILIAGVAPAAALAGGVPPRPAAGKWTWFGGGFTVNSAGTELSNLYAYPGDASGGPCGKSLVHFVGSLPITAESGGGVTEWGASSARMPVKQGHKNLIGSVDIAFDASGFVGSNDGDIYWGTKAQMDTIDGVRCSGVFVPKHTG